MKTDWPDLKIITQDIEVPQGLVTTLMKDGEISEVVQRLAEWFPEISTGSESRFLDAQFHQSAVLSDKDRYYPIIARNESDGTPIFYFVVEWNEGARTVSSPMAALNPAFRRSGTGISFIPGKMLYSIGKHLGAGLAYYYSTLGSLGAQRISEMNGYQLVGIIPSFDRDSIQGKPMRVYEGIYAKALDNGELVKDLDSEGMTEKTRALFEFLFGRVSTPPTSVGP